MFLRELSFYNEEESGRRDLLSDGEMFVAIDKWKLKFGIQHNDETREFVYQLSKKMTRKLIGKEE